MDNSTISLIRGDCLEKMKDISDKSIDMILCDLPYGTTACKWDVVIPFEPLWAQYKRIIKDRGAIALFGSEPFSSYLRMSNIKEYKYDWYFKKTKAIGFQHAKNKPMKIIETVSIFSNGMIGHKDKNINRMQYYPQGVIPWKNRIVSPVWHGNMMGARPNQVGKGYLAYTNFPNDLLLDFKQPVGNKTLSPTEKSVGLLEYLIKTYTLENETVLDNCMGSGSTGVACINTNRKFIGIEKDENYFTIAKERIDKELDTRLF